MSTITRFFSFLLVLALGGCGIWLDAQGLGDVIEAFQSASWPSSQGIILKSEVETSSGHRGTNYTPHIKYTYTTGKQILLGETISPGRMWTRTSAYEAVQRFPTLTHAEVYYSPSDPKRSVLENGLHPANFGQLGFGLIFLAMSVLAGIKILAPVIRRRGYPS